jgi:hypothetical protein
MKVNEFAVTPRQYPPQDYYSRAPVSGVKVLFSDTR